MIAVPSEKMPDSKAIVLNEDETLEIGVPPMNSKKTISEFPLRTRPSV